MSKNADNEDSKHCIWALQPVVDVSFHVVRSHGKGDREDPEPAKDNESDRPMEQAAEPLPTPVLQKPVQIPLSVGGATIWPKKVTVTVEID
ncbi:MAG: hypothetical protein AAF560_34085 [Acidobacteriota bacterium]